MLSPTRRGLITWPNADGGLGLSMFDSYPNYQGDLVSIFKNRLNPLTIPR